MKGYFFLFILSAYFALINLYATPVHAVKGVALVIGNEDYKNKDYQVANNAYKMATALREANFYVMPVVLNAGLAKMRKAIKNFEKKIEKKLNDSAKETVGLFYYSGYVANYDEKTHLFPVGVYPDSKWKDEDTTITLDYVIKKMNTEPRILILDAFKSSHNDNPLKSVSTSKAETFIAYAISYTKYDQERSVYTKALLRSMKEKKPIEIEMLIKDVNEVAKKEGHKIASSQSSLTISFSFVEIVSPSSPTCNENTEINTIERQFQKKDNIQNVTSVAWSPKSYYALSAGKDDGILWNMRKGKGNEGYKFFDDNSIVESVSFSPDREFFVSGHSDGKVYLWKDQGHQQYTQVSDQKYIKNSSPVASVSFSPDGRDIVLAGSEDGKIWLWEKDKDKVTENLKNKIFSVAFSEDGEKIIIGSEDGIYLWDWEKNKRPSGPYKVFCNSKAYSVKFFPKPKDDFLVVGCGNQVKIGKIINKGIVKVQDLLPKFSDKAYSVDVSKDGIFILSGSWDNTVRLWKLEKNSYYKPLEPLEPLEPIKEKKNRFHSVSFSPDDNRFLLGGDNGMSLWEIVCD